jgi:hypothetical protein
MLYSIYSGSYEQSNEHIRVYKFLLIQLHCLNFISSCIYPIEVIPIGIVSKFYRSQPGKIHDFWITLQKLTHNSLRSTQAVLVGEHVAYSILVIFLCIDSSTSF